MPVANDDLTTGLAPTIGISPGQFWTGLVCVIGRPVDASVIARGKRSPRMFDMAVLERAEVMIRRHWHDALAAWGARGVIVGPGAIPYRLVAARPGPGRQPTVLAVRRQVRALEERWPGLRLVVTQDDRETPDLPEVLRAPWPDDWLAHDAAQLEGGHLDKRRVRAAYRAALAGWT